MHNGGLGGWKYIKRRLGERLADKWYLGVAGGTDSEWAFALFLDTLERMGFDPSSQPEGGFGPIVLRKAMLRTIDIINELIDGIPESLVHSENIDTRSLLNFALTDGHSIICTRYVGSSTDEAASLYYSSGTLWETREADPANRDYQMERSDKGADVVLVASEPLSFERGMFNQLMGNQLHGTELTSRIENWVNVPTNSILTIHNQTVLVHPIKDQYYEQDPQQRRSTAFVSSKGLAANEKTSSRGAAATLMPSIEIESPQQHAQKKFLGPIIPSFTPNRGRTTTDPAGVRGRTPLANVETASSSSNVPDVRNITAPPQLLRAGSQQPPAQGNIKKKRASLSAALGEPYSAASIGYSLTSTLTNNSTTSSMISTDTATSPLTPEPGRSEFGNPNKIAQFFPELTPYH